MAIAPSRPVPSYPPPGGSSAPVEVSYDDFMAMPVTKQHVEVVDGVIYVMPGATFEHQHVGGRIYRKLIDFVEAHELGLVLLAPADVIIRKVPKLRVRQPDVMFFSNARAGFDASADPGRVQSENQAGRLAPDLVVEVLSPGQNEATLADKLGDYASIRVEEVWFADQEAKSIRVLARDGAAYRPAGEHRAGDRVGSAVLPGIDLEVAPLFG